MTPKTFLRCTAIALLTSSVAMTIACGPPAPSGGSDNNENNTNNTTGSNNATNNTTANNTSNNTVGTNNATNNTTGPNNTANNTTGTNNTTGSNNANNTTGTNNTTGSNNSNNTTGTNNSNNTNNTNGTNNTNQADRMAASAAIADFRAEMTGTVTGAFVTYIRPAIGNDGAGFFIQAEQDGPAIFVAVDPTTLTPAPVAGDEVELTVDTVEVNNDVPTATAISAFSVLSNGNDIDALVQDVNAVDLVTNLGDYESEVIDLTGTIAGDFGFAGTGFVSAQLDTAGVTGNEDLRLRLPETLADTLSLAVGCEVQINGTPLWRFRADAQPSAWDASEIDILSCPAPTVAGAVATSDTEVVLTFDRPIDPASITNAATQFTADNGLTVSTATVNGNEVTLTTSTQAGGTAYTITVADTVLDDLGGMVDQAANTATFNGFITPAKVLINEVAANVADGCDIIELRVTQGGSLDGFTIEERGSAIYTFGALNVVKNDYIIVHFDKDDADCNGTSPVDELNAKNEMTQDMNLNILDIAFDVFTTDTGITGTNNVLSVRTPSGVLEDTMIFGTVATAMTFASATETAADEVLQEGGWGPVNGAPPANYADPIIGQDAVVNSQTGSGQPSSNNDVMRRLNDADNNNKADWTATPDATNTFGVNNPGQNDL